MINIRGDKGNSHGGSRSLPPYTHADISKKLRRSSSFDGFFGVVDPKKEETFSRLRPVNLGVATPSPSTASSAGSTPERSRKNKRTHKISFRYSQDSLLNRNSSELKKLHAQITISVGCSESHSGDYFRDTLNKAAWRHRDSASPQTRRG